MKQSIDQDAARWAIVLRDSQASFEDIDRALNWIYSMPERTAAFDRAERFLKECDAMARDRVVRGRLSELEPFFGRPHWLGRWNAMTAIAAGFAVIVAASLLIGWQSRLTPQAVRQIHYASAVGKLRTVDLSDGSKITLGGASAVTVAYGAATRKITIVQGEALFDVAPDRDRPFIVTAGTGMITAIGTSFDVHRHSNGATVTVIHGIVDVVSERPEFFAKRLLRRGMEVSYSEDGAMSPVRYVNLQTALGWRRGKLNFNNQALGAVIEDLNRYSPTPIVVDDDALELMPVTGAVETNGIVEWLQALAEVMDIEIVARQDMIVLRARRQIAKPPYVDGPRPSRSSREKTVLEI